ncbi:MAG TPA: hypothetical protein VGE38_09325 [Nocardioides sp.]|uniref:hypothetical protein n=1 Tax=Nocardioides sp. TaxID=35761 RepID=UPI002EDA2D1A
MARSELDVSPHALRLLGSLATAVAVVGAALLVPGGASEAGGRTGSFTAQHDAARAAAAPRASDAAVLADDGHSHDHGDPATKNAVSRSTEQVPDPTTPAQRASAHEHVAAERALPDPPLTSVSAGFVNPVVPDDVHALANGCYALAGEPVFFQPTALGTYLLHDRSSRLIGPAGRRETTPRPALEWRATQGEDGFTFTNNGLVEQQLVIGAQRRFPLRLTTGCTPYPEIELDVSGDPHAGVTAIQEVRGYVDAHTHGMAFEFLGGQVHCGRPWHKYGAPYALVDCPDHTYTGGVGGVLESAMSGRPRHDPVGWPTFRDWPAPDSLTHEGTYWKWIERSWRGGQRILVNLFVENNKLCQVYPLKRNRCDDMASVRLQARRIYELQDYIDAQYGGPGRGFFRIVTDPFQARQVVNAGKLAVVLGIETSVPFGCTMKIDVPQCSAAEIERQLDEVRALGVSQMELVNKFDNALSGVAGDSGAIGPLVNGANFLETGSFWDMRHCEPADGESHDQNQVTALPDLTAGTQDALFGAVAQLAIPRIALPAYPRPDHCNARGLTDLGVHTIEALARRHMLFDPDHMSVAARQRALDVIERLGYPGVVSSHSWSTPDAYPRIYRAGGFVAPYAGDSTGFVAKWRRHLGWADPRYYFGFGYGADINGLGAQGLPRGADAPDPVRYPFQGLGGVSVGQQRSGERVYDINLDGVAHYGLYPDWTEDLRQVAGPDGSALVDDLARGAEAYLQTWERAYGVRPDSCRNPSLRRPVAEVADRVGRGMTPVEVMRAVGQPYQRLGHTFTLCALGQRGETVTMRVEFDGRDRVSGVRRS